MKKLKKEQHANVHFRVRDFVICTEIKYTRHFLVRENLKTLLSLTKFSSLNAGREKNFRSCFQTFRPIIFVFKKGL